MSVFHDFYIGVIMMQLLVLQPMSCLYPTYIDAATFQASVCMCMFHDKKCLK